MHARHLLLVLLAVVALAQAGRAEATPSTQIWIPSTDLQKFKVVHLTYDVYARPGKTTILALGPTVGVSPWQALQAEVGFDVMLQSSHVLDDAPLYLHAKLGTPEDALFGGSPALAAGMFNVGLESGLTDQNVGYALLARTLPIAGRLSAGYHFGNPKVLVDENGKAANHGLLLSWDRTLAELTDKLWLAVDYQGARSGLGAVNAGFAWAVTPDASFIVGYNHYLNEKVAGKDTFTVQMDVNL